MGRNPIKEELAVAHNRGTTTIRAKRGKKDVMVASKGIKRVLTIKGQNKIFGRAGGPTTTKKAQRGFVSE